MELSETEKRGQGTWKFNNNLLNDKHYIDLIDLFRFICCFMSHSTARVIFATGSLQVEETSAYCTVNHRALASNYQLSNMKRPARDSNRRPQRLEARTLTTTPTSPLIYTL